MLQSQISLQYKAAQEREGAPAPFTILTVPYRVAVLLAHGLVSAPTRDRSRSRNSWERLGGNHDNKRSITDKIFCIYEDRDLLHLRSTGRKKDDDLWLRSGEDDRWGSTWHKKREKRHALEDEVNSHARKDDTDRARLDQLDAKVDKLIAQVRRHSVPPQQCIEIGIVFPANIVFPGNLFGR